MAPVSGRFEADFANFMTAVDGATVKLRGFESDANKVGASLSRMADQFSGTRVIQQATLMTEAVERIGGAGKLTEQELQRIAPTINEAIAKMEKLGQSVPENMKQLQTATKGVSTEVGAMGGIVSQLAGPMIALFTVDKVIDFTKEVLAAGDAIQKMADQTSMSTDQIQKLQYVAGQSGSSVESMVSAAQNLMVKLGEGDQGVVGGLRRMNINLEEFKTLDTYDQMLRLSEGIRTIQEPTEQAAVAAQVFGKNWKEILPALKSDMASVAAEAPVMSKATVEGLDRIGDALTSTKQHATAWAGGWLVAIKEVLVAIDDASSRLTKFQNFGSSNSEMVDPMVQAKKNLESIKPAQLAYMDGIQQIKVSEEDLRKIYAGDAPRMEAAKKAEEAQIQRKKDELELARQLAAANKEYWDAVGKLMERTTGKEAIDAAMKWKDAIELLGGDVSRFSNKDLADLETAMQAGIEGLVKSGQATSVLGDQFVQLMIKSQTFRESQTAATVATEGASGTVTDYTRKLYEQALAEDKVRDELGKKTDQLNDATKAYQTATYSMNSAYSTGDLSELAAKSGGQIALDSYGNKYVWIPGKNAAPPGRASGGPVNPNTSYVVGERGPELFTPSTAGSISPNGAGGPVVQNYFNIVDTESNIAKRVSDHILRTITQARRVT